MQEGESKRRIRLIRRKLIKTLWQAVPRLWDVKSGIKDGKGGRL